MSRTPGDKAWLECDASSGLAVATCGAGPLGAFDVMGRFVAVLGEIVVGGRSLAGADASAWVAAGGAADALPPPDGQFVVVCADPVRGEVVVHTDRLATRPVYVARVGESVVVASELKALVAAGLEPRIDMQAWAELLAFEHALADRSPLEGARLLGPSTTLTFDTSGAQRQRVRERYLVEPEPLDEPARWVDEFESLLGAAVAERLDERTVFALSGGLDSRCIAAVLPGDVGLARLLTVTFGMAGAEEIERAAAVAEALGLSHEVIGLRSGYIGETAGEVVWLSEGRIRAFHAHHLALRGLRVGRDVDALMIGYAGDAVVRWGAMTVAGAFGFADSDAGLVEAVHRRSCVALDEQAANEVLTPSFASELRGRARSGIEDALGAGGGPSERRRIQFAIDHVYPQKILPGVSLHADAMIARDPYVDAELLAFLRRVPRELRVGGELQRALLRRTPAIARIRNPKDGIAPSLTGRRLRAARQAIRVRRAAAARLEPVKRRLGRTPRGGVGDYAADLQTPAGGALLGVLLEARTLDRGQIRGEPVRAMIRDTLTGRRPRTQVLGMLVTLELFQRQFVDEDGRLRSTPVAPPPTSAMAVR